MATFVTLANFTDQGARSIKDSPQRFEAFKAMAEEAGLVVKGAYWTMGAHDIVLITEGTEEAQMVASMKGAALGNVRTQTLRAFTAAEMKKLVSKLG